MTPKVRANVPAMTGSSGAPALTSVSSARRPGDGVRIIGEVGKHERHALETPALVGRRVGVQQLRDERLSQDDWRALEQQRYHQIAEAVGVRNGDRGNLAIIGADVHGRRDMDGVRDEL